MNRVKGCICFDFRYKDKIMLSPIKYGDEDNFKLISNKCHDCNCRIGGYHHPGCGVEICPRCKAQAISCNCELDGYDQ